MCLFYFKRRCCVWTCIWMVLAYVRDGDQRLIKDNSFCNYLTIGQQTSITITLFNLEFLSTLKQHWKCQ